MKCIICQKVYAQFQNISLDFNDVSVPELQNLSYKVILHAPAHLYIP